MEGGLVASSNDFVDELINCCMAFVGTVAAGGVFGAALTFLAIPASPHSIIPGFTLGLMYSAIPGVVVSPVVFLLSVLAGFQSDERRTRCRSADRRTDRGRQCLCSAVRVAPRSSPCTGCSITCGRHFRGCREAANWQTHLDEHTYLSPFSYRDAANRLFLQQFPVESAATGANRIR